MSFIASQIGQCNKHNDNSHPNHLYKFKLVHYCLQYLALSVHEYEFRIQNTNLYKCLSYPVHLCYHASSCRF